MFQPIPAFTLIILNLGNVMKSKFLHLRNKTFFVFLSRFNVNLLVFYHEYRFLIGYATHYDTVDSAVDSEYNPAGFR